MSSRICSWFAGIVMVMFAIHGSCPSDGLAQAAPQGTIRMTIGRFDGNEGEVFGRIRDAHVDRAGRLIVLDEMNLVIRLYSNSGKYVGSAGRKGGGPGEFRGIEGSALGPDDQLFVADAGNQRISIFQLTRDGIAYSRALTLRFLPRDVCFLGDRMYVLRSADPAFQGSLIAEVGQDGRIIRTFASPEQPSAEERIRIGIFNWMRNWGSIACDQSNNRIILLNEYVPVIRAFTPDGAESWRAAIDDYNPIHFRLARGGQCCSFGVDPRLGSYHSGQAILVDANGRVVVGLQETIGRWLPQQLRYEMYIVEGGSGRRLAREGAAGVPFAVTSDAVYLYVQEPYPQVKVVERGRRR